MTKAAAALTQHYEQGLFPREKEIYGAAVALALAKREYV